VNTLQWVVRKVPLKRFQILVGWALDKNMNNFNSTNLETNHAVEERKSVDLHFKGILHIKKTSQVTKY
jgi:hypothetical protein